MTGRLTKMLLATAAMTALTGVAYANDEGWYIFGDVGYSMSGSFEPDNSIFATGALDQDENWMALFGAGYQYAYGLRLEAEGGYRNNDLSGGDFFEGSTSAWSLMGNAFYDFNRGSAFQPYVGIGVGAAWVDVDGLSPNFEFDDDDTVFAWQGMVGIAWHFNPQLAMDLGYRYFSAADVGFKATVFPNNDVEAGGDYDQEAVTLGLRYIYAPPPPPPMPPPPPPAPRPAAPAPAACPTSEFVVYFEWDHSDLNAEAQETINAALERARQCHVASAMVVGHTDTSGSTEYNQGLSERRAGVVRDALAAGGMSASMIMTEAHGESDLARATPDGVREPLNRRTAVTITFR